MRLSRIARLDLDRDLQRAGALESKDQGDPLSPLEWLLEADDHEVRTARSQRETLPRRHLEMRDPPHAHDIALAYGDVQLRAPGGIARLQGWRTWMSPLS